MSLAHPQRFSYLQAQGQSGYSSRNPIKSLRWKGMILPAELICSGKAFLGISALVGSWQRMWGISLSLHLSCWWAEQGSFEAEALTWDEIEGGNIRNLAADFITVVYYYFGSESTISRVEDVWPCWDSSYQLPGSLTRMSKSKGSGEFPLKCMKGQRFSCCYVTCL